MHGRERALSSFSCFRHTLEPQHGGDRRAGCEDVPRQYRPWGKLRDGAPVIPPTTRPLLSSTTAAAIAVAAGARAHAAASPARPQPRKSMARGTAHDMMLQTVAVTPPDEYLLAALTRMVAEAQIAVK